MDYSNEWLTEQTRRWDSRKTEFDIAAPDGWKSPTPDFDFIVRIPAYRQVMGLLPRFAWIPPWQVAGEVLLWRHYFRIHNAPVLGEVALAGPPMSPEEGLHLALLDLPFYAFRDALPLLGNDTARQIFHLDAIEVDRDHDRATMARFAAGWLQPCWNILTVVREEAFCRGYAEVLPVMRFLHRCVGIEPDTVAVGPLTVLAYNNKVKGIMFAKTLPDYFLKEAVHDIRTYAKRAFEDKSPEFAVLADKLMKSEKVRKDDVDGMVFEQLMVEAEKQMKAAATCKPIQPFAAVDLRSNESTPDFLNGAVVRGIAARQRKNRRRKKRETQGSREVLRDAKSSADKGALSEAADPSECVQSFQDVRDAREWINAVRKALIERGDTVAVARLEWIEGRAFGSPKTQAEIASRHGVTLPQMKARAVKARVDNAIFEHLKRA